MSIEIPRKRRKQIKKLKGKTASLLGEQRKVLEHANAILAEARGHAADAARKDLAPRVQNAIDNGIRPASQRVSRRHLGCAERIRTVSSPRSSPASSRPLAPCSASGTWRRDPRVQKIVKEAQKRGGKLIKQAPVPQKKGIGFGGVALIVVGVVAVAGAAYCAVPDAPR